MSSRAIQILVQSFPKILIPGIIYTIPLTLISFAIGLILAVIVALLRIRSHRIVQGICWFYVWVFRGTPQLVQLFVIFYGLPSIGIRWNALLCAVIAFSLNVGAYASETIRGAILSVPNGQKEAAYACGMTYSQTMLYVVLPQALKASIPALSNTFISLVKDTSLASNITVTEMFMVTIRLVAVTYEPLLLYLEVGFIYLIFCTILTYLQGKLEKRLALGTRKEGTA